MSMEFLLATGIGFVTACAVYLMLRGRTFSVVLGLSLFGYAVNVFLFAMGRLWTNAQPILVGEGTVADPLPQATEARIAAADDEAGREQGRADGVHAAEVRRERERSREAREATRVRIVSH